MRQIQAVALAVIVFLMAVAAIAQTPTPTPTPIPVWRETATGRVVLTPSAAANYAVRLDQEGGLMKFWDSENLAGLSLTQIATSDVSWGNVLVVAKSGGDYTTVQAAVNAASAGTSVTPTLILIAPGEYAETVTITNKNIHLCGLGPRESVTITREQTVVGTLDYGEATVNVDPGAGRVIGLQNLTIRNTGGGGGEAACAVLAGNGVAAGSEYVKVFNCHIESGGRDAFAVLRVDLHLRDSYLKNADGHAHTFWGAYDETTALVERCYLYTNAGNPVIQLTNNGDYRFSYNYYGDNATIDVVNSATINRTADFSAQNTIHTANDPLIAASLKTNSISNVSGNAAISVTDNLTLQIDSDNNGTNTFSILNGGLGTPLSLTEAGQLSILAGLTLNSVERISGAGVGTFTQTNTDNVRIDGNTISTTDTNGDLNLEPNGSGDVLSTKKLGLGTATPAARLEVQTGASEGAAAILIDQDDSDEDLIGIEATVTANHPETSQETITTYNPGTGDVTGPIYDGVSEYRGWVYYGMVRVKVNGTTRYMPIYDYSPSP